MHGPKIYSWNLTSGETPVHTRVDVHRKRNFIIQFHIWRLWKNTYDTTFLQKSKLF